MHKYIIFDNRSGAEDENSAAAVIGGIAAGINEIVEKQVSGDDRKGSIRTVNGPALRGTGRENRRGDHIIADRVANYHGVRIILAGDSASQPVSAVAVYGIPANNR